MTAKIDDLEAVRILAETLQPFAGDDRERIIRWAREKLGMTTSAASALRSRVETTSDAPRDAVVTGSQGAVDIKKFVTEKSPKPLAALVPVERLEQMRRFARRHAFEFMDQQRPSALTDVQASALAADAKRWARSASRSRRKTK